MDGRARYKLATLVEDMGSQAQVARALDVDRSRVSRWLADEEPDRENLLKLEAVEFALSRLQLTYQRSTAMKWLFGFNAHLGQCSTDRPAHARPGLRRACGPSRLTRPAPTHSRG